jgi:hypothetical protein
MEVLKEEMKKLKEKIEKEREILTSKEKFGIDTDKSTTSQNVISLFNTSGNSTLSSLAIAKQYEHLQLQLKVLFNFI